MIARTAFALYSSVAGNAVTSAAFAGVKQTSDLLVQAECSSQSFSGSKSPILSELIELAAAAPLTYDKQVDLADAVQGVENLLHAMPNYIGAPDVSLDQDAEIRLDWAYSRSRMISVIVTGRKRLAYSAINGGHSQYGTMEYDGVNVPSSLVALFLELVAGRPHGIAA